MIVDYLRSCYRSEFLIDAVNDVSVIGRFYRPPVGAQVYHEPTIFRAGIWLDEWELDLEPGDTLEGFTYDKGARDFVVVDDRKRTRLAQVGCDRALTLVAGAGGFPIACRGIPVGDLSVRWTDAGWRDSVTLEEFATGQNIVPQFIPKVGENTWELTYVGLGWSHFFRATIEGYKIQLAITSTPAIGSPSAHSVVEWPLEAPFHQYGPKVATPVFPWEYQSPTQEFSLILFSSTP